MNRKNNRFKSILTGLLAANIFLSLWIVATQEHKEWRFSETQISIDKNAPAYFETVFNYTSGAGVAHSPAIRIIGSEFSIIWFDGTREAATDVIIKSIQFHKTDDLWIAGSPLPLISRDSLGSVTSPKQKVLILGNTIDFHGETDGVLATIVSIGGWAMSSIAHVQLKDDIPQKATKLSLSPALNRSHLVRSPMISFTDGDYGLPAYFEMGNAFGELVRLTPDGRVNDKIRITNGRLGIQPMIVVTSPLEAVALLRNFSKASGNLVASWTKDGGKSWSKQEFLDIPNPDSPVAALRLSNEKILMAFNDSTDRRNNLKLAVSEDDGHTWTRIFTLEDHGEEPGTDTRYPMMQYLPDGQIVLTYSWGSKKGIRAYIFNESWVNNQ